MVQDEYKVNLEVFEGPLDLLLYLIRKEEVDIYNIPIERVTTQYLEYLNLMKLLDLNIAGEFIVMAATLMMIKSRMLLPVEERPELEAEEEDPRWDLVRQLLEYKKFKDAAMRLQDMEIRQENVFAGGGKSVAIEPQDAGTALQDISLFDLITAFSSVLKRARPEEIGEIFATQYTVADKIQVILKDMSRGGERSFVSFFPPTASKHEVICTFLAMLELIRLHQVRVRQDRHFDEILVCGVENPPSFENVWAEEPAAAEISVNKPEPEPPGTVDEGDEHGES
ncbi:MAG: hypothetical protein A2498_01400 [Lentisphaerae bacterium RIFOXYC12_FULL_60_16]|nr:MAG: hypothetical protein A2498_01400 [Lentisphaerae bacterium RIFOXYC12_FULL_60_16]OGV78335.1 MAG: hypothetical protein A2340_15955 [Lentisphaerae bacterium RIFOXYB12_FULL_60_10]